MRASPSTFDPEALEAALATEARAQDALDQDHRHHDVPAIGCLRLCPAGPVQGRLLPRPGLRAVAVHSDAGPALRATSPDQPGRGEIDGLFAVDMFNETMDRSARSR